jgi:hypothetical protein
MTVKAKAETLLEAIEGRLAEISARQHALAAEKTQLQAQITPLRLGVVSPDVAVAHLREKGITLRGLATARRAGRRLPGVVLKAVPIHRPVAALPLDCSQSA